MKKGSNNGLVIFGAVVALGGAIAKALSYYNDLREFAKKVDVEIYDIAINSQKTNEANWSKIYFRVRLWIVNPTEFTGTLNGASVGLVINGKLVAAAKRQGNISITRKAKTPLTLDLSINTAEAGESLAALIKGGLDGLKLGAKGSVIVNRTVIPFNLPFANK